MKRHFTSFLLVAVFLIGLSLLLYPSFSNWWNTVYQRRNVAGYAETVANINNDTYERLLAAAEEYNARIAQSGLHIKLTEEQRAEYEALLPVTQSGIMATIEIPKIKLELPIYHGTDEQVLESALGHLEGSSLPVGGASTHCVISGHRGLPSARLFTDLDRLTVGDTFTVNTLDEVLTYEVDQILIVEPHDLAALQIVEGEDYCTLVTCTPYGINTHRLLVRGHRVENAAPTRTIRVVADAVQMDTTLVAIGIAAPLLLVTSFAAMILPRKPIKASFRKENL